MSKTLQQDLKDLSKAHTYANWSVFGFIIPIVGLILAGMSFSFLKVIPLNKDTELRIQQVKKTAWLGIVVSIITMLFWGGFYKYNSWQNDKELVSQQNSSNSNSPVTLESTKINDTAENRYQANFMAECVGVDGFSMSYCKCGAKYMIANYDVKNRLTYRQIFDDSTTTSVPEYYMKNSCT